LRQISKTVLLFAVAGTFLLSKPAWCGEAGKTFAGYALGGAALGALLGSAGATVPYLNDKQSFDFLVGAGGGALAGSVTGLILGIFDVASSKNQSQTTTDLKRTEGPYVVVTSSAAFLIWNKPF